MKTYSKLITFVIAIMLVASLVGCGTPAAPTTEAAPQATVEQPKATEEKPVATEPPAPEVTPTAATTGYNYIQFAKVATQASILPYATPRHLMGSDSHASSDLILSLLTYEKYSMRDPSSTTLIVIVSNDTAPTDRGLKFYMNDPTYRPYDGTTGSFLGTFYSLVSKHVPFTDGIEIGATPFDPSTTIKSFIVGSQLHLMQAYLSRMCVVYLGIRPRLDPGSTNANSMYIKSAVGGIKYPKTYCRPPESWYVLPTKHYGSYFKPDPVPTNSLFQFVTCRGINESSDRTQINAFFPQYADLYTEMSFQCEFMMIERSTNTGYDTPVFGWWLDDNNWVAAGNSVKFDGRTGFFKKENGVISYDYTTNNIKLSGNAYTQIKFTKENTTDLTKSICRFWYCIANINYEDKTDMCTIFNIDSTSKGTAFMGYYNTSESNEVKLRERFNVAVAGYIVTGGKI